MEVRDADAQLLCSLADEFAGLGAHSVCNLSAVDAILHHQDLELANVVDDEFLEAIGQHMTGLSVAAITDVWHEVLTLEATTDAIVNTFWLSPVALKR